MWPCGWGCQLPGDAGAEARKNEFTNRGSPEQPGGSFLELVCPYRVTHKSI